MLLQREFGHSRKQINYLAQNIPKGNAAGFLLIEHLWTKEIKSRSHEKRVVLLTNGFITIDSLVAMGAHLAEEVKAAEKSHRNITVSFDFYDLPLS